MIISASIVTFNSSDEIRTILSNLFKCLKYGLSDVYVVDNNSSDNCVQLIKNEFPWVKIIESKNNLGYGGGHNLAISKVNSDFHLIINPDISINVYQFKSIVDFCSGNDFAIACPKVLNSDGSEQFLPKRHPKLKYIFGGTFHFLHRLREEYTMQNLNLTDITDVEFCTGCFMICNTTKLKYCGGFDERYFMYLEDADLSREMKKYGRVLYNPNISVTHLWKRENRKSIKGVFRWFNSYFKYKKKWKN